MLFFWKSFKSLWKLSLSLSRSLNCRYASQEDVMVFIADETMVSKLFFSNAFMWYCCKTLPPQQRQFPLLETSSDSNLHQCIISICLIYSKVLNGVKYYLLFFWVFVTFLKKNLSLFFNKFCQILSVCHFFYFLSLF